MKRRTARDLTAEVCDDSHTATARFSEVAEAADEGGGPSLSRVTVAERNEVWPTDPLPRSGDARGSARKNFPWTV